MLRDFSEEKKKELYEALEVIDIKEWKPFMAWCGGRAGEFGVWADKLGISAYTGRIDNYQNRVLDTNDSTRNQIDVIFENVEETDRRYAEIFRGYAEGIREQISQVQALIQVLSLVNENDIESENYIAMKDAVRQLNKSQELDYVERLLDGYLKENRFNNSVEREVIIQLIREEHSQMLLNLYITDRYSTADSRGIVREMIAYYEKKKMNISLEEVIEKFEQDINSCSGKRFDEYLEYLQTLQYICHADADNIRNTIGKNKQDICIFLNERMKLIESLSEDKTYGVIDRGWSREQIMCALQIEAELAALDYDKEFIAGFIGNVKNEGKFGIIEDMNANGRLVDDNGEEAEVPHWIHIINCLNNYLDDYANKELTDVNLVQLYVDLICKSESGECTDKDNHKFGIGVVQWTGNERDKKLMEFYFEQVGYDINSPQFDKLIQDWQSQKNDITVYLTENQIREAETNMLIYELTLDNTDTELDDTNIYTDYSNTRSNNNQDALWEATNIVMNDYEKPRNKNIDERYAAAQRWYEISTEQ